MSLIGAQPGVQHLVNRGNNFTDVIKLYKRGDTIDECPLWISYDIEIAVDEGVVTRDMFSAFWEAAYTRLFEGATLLTPLLHPQMDMGVLSRGVGRISDMGGGANYTRVKHFRTGSHAH